MVWRFAKNQGLAPGGALNFSDKPDTWAAEGISGIIAHGWYSSDVTQDSGVWSYRPQDTMTREEAAALIGLSIKEVPGSLSAAAAPVPMTPAPAAPPAAVAPVPLAPARSSTGGHGARAVDAGTCSSPGNRGARTVGAAPAAPRPPWHPCRWRRHLQLNPATAPVPLTPDPAPPLGRLYLHRSYRPRFRRATLRPAFLREAFRTEAWRY